MQSACKYTPSHYTPSLLLIPLSPSLLSLSCSLQIYAYGMVSFLRNRYVTYAYGLTSGTAFTALYTAVLPLTSFCALLVCMHSVARVAQLPSDAWIVRQNAPAATIAVMLSPTHGGLLQRSREPEGYLIEPFFCVMPMQVIALAIGFLWQLFASYKGYNVSATHSISECFLPAFVLLGLRNVVIHAGTCQLVIDCF